MTKLRLGHFSFEFRGLLPRDGERWAVAIQRAAFRGHKYRCPTPIDLGTVDLFQPPTRTVFAVIHEGREDACVAEADRLIKSSVMWDALWKARLHYLRDEQRCGDFLLKVDGDFDILRFNSLERAHDYAIERLTQAWRWGLPRQRRAEVFRHLTGGTTALLKGSPWSIPFQAWEINDHGQIRMAGLTDQRRLFGKEEAL